MTALADALPNDVETLRAMLLAERARADRLSKILNELQRHRFGRRAETLPINELELKLELELEDVQPGGGGRCGSRGEKPVDQVGAGRDGARTGAPCRRIFPASSG